MDRRAFLKKADLAGAGLLLDGKHVMSQTLKDTGNIERNRGIKNILLLFTDQHRQDCLGCYGNPVVRTPNIDRLAHNGIRFNNAFTPTPVCTPARTSLQTGLWAHNHKLMYNTGTNSERNGGPNDPESSIQFFSELLKQKEWQLANIGKWHIGTEINKPSAHGYEELPYYPEYGYPSNHKHYIDYLRKQGVNGFNLIKEVRDPSGMLRYSAMQEGSQSASIPAYLAGQTVDVIERFANSDKPFFISCNFWGPHGPHNIMKRHYEMYDDAPDIEPWPNFDCDLSDKPGMIRKHGEFWKTQWFTRENLPKLIAKYYGYITLIDEEIGRILKTLENTDELDRTLIIFSADHGSGVGSYRTWDKGYGMYDTTNRIPMIFSHPSINPGVSDAFVTLLDFAPTFLEIAGCGVPKEMEGVSLLPILKEEQKTVREDHIITEQFGLHFGFWQRMVRTQSSKFIFNPLAIDEFYDLESDPYETKNIADSIDKKQLNRFKEMLHQWMKDTHDPLLFWANRALS